LLERETKRLNEKAKSGSLVGSTDHPTDGRTKISESAIQWTSMYMEGKYVIGEAIVLPTSAGRDLEALIRSGVPVGVSSRGFGRSTPQLVEGRKVEVVDDDYELLAYDAVLAPAVEEAVLQLGESAKEKKNCELTDAQKRMRQLSGLNESYPFFQDSADGVHHANVLDIDDQKHAVSKPSNNAPEFRKKLEAAVLAQKKLEVDALEPFAENSWAIFEPSQRQSSAMQFHRKRKR
jgi:hypothetical protein